MRTVVARLRWLGLMSVAVLASAPLVMIIAAVAAFIR
jgi:hypothetical protein